MERSVRHKTFAPEAHLTFGGGGFADLFGGNISCMTELTLDITDV